MKATFKCSECGSGVLEEILFNVVQTSTIQVIEDGAVDYVENSIITEEGEVSRYQCSECGEVVKDKNGCTIDDPEELFDHLISLYDLDKIKSSKDFNLHRSKRR